MNKSKFSIISDLIFLIFSIFTLAFLSLAFYIGSLALNIIISGLITFLTVSIIKILTDKKNFKKSLTLKRCSEIDSLALSFSLMTDYEQLEFLQSLFSNNYVLDKKTKCLKNSNDKVISYTENEINQQTMINLTRNYKNCKNLTIFCINFDKKALKSVNFIENLAINIYDKIDLYDLCVEKNKLPKKIENTITKTSKLKLILSNIISESKSKGYLICGILILFNSLFLPTKIYYRLIGTILIILSIICKLNKYKSNKIDNKINL